MKVKDSPGIKTRVRLYTVEDEDKYHADRAQSGNIFALGFCKIDREKENLIVTPFYQSQANVHAGIQATWENLRWYAQALGTSTTTPARADVGLNYEAFRKQYTDFSPTAGNPTGRVITMNTFFASSDYSNYVSTISAATAPTSTQFSVTAVSGVPVAGSLPITIGDLLQVQLPTKFEYSTVTAIAGNLITVSPAFVSGVPVVGAAVSQCTEEAGFFGNLSASISAGTVALTNGSAAVTGTSTNFTRTFAGDLIRFPGSSQPRTWYTVLSVASDTALTLTANFTGTTIASTNAVCRGTIFNHVNLLRYVKAPTKGFVFEDVWNIGGY